MLREVCIVKGGVHHKEICVREVCIVKGGVHHKEIRVREVCIVKGGVHHNIGTIITRIVSAKGDHMLHANQ